MWLPPDLYDNPDWMGFAFCAVFSFHKHPTAVCKNLNLYEQNLQKFTRTVVQCVISYVDYLYVIRGSCKKAVYERLPFYRSDEFNGSDGLYEDLDRPWLPISQEETSGTSSQYSYENSHSWEQFYKTGALVKISTPYSIYTLVQI